MVTPIKEKYPDPGRVVSTATVRAAEILGLSQETLARVLGVSEASVSRLKRSQRQIDVRTKEGELALLFVRMFRSLDALLSGDEVKAQAWLRAHNTHLGGAAVDRIQTVEGLVDVIRYLDAMRGKI